MKKFFLSLYLNKYFLAFIVIFAYLEAIQIRFYYIKKLHWHLFTPDAALGQLINALLLFVIIGLVIRRLDVKILFSQAIKVFFISLAIYVFGNNFLSFLIALAFGTVERNFNTHSLVSSNIKHVIDVFVYGGFFLANYYFHKNQEDKAKLSKLEKAQIESQLAQLKAQLDPHFLFNNLNVLDQLIEEDKESASGFLHDFSDIYRYVLQSSDQKLVSLQEELDFAQRYFRLMQHKYGDAYTWEVAGLVNPKALLPPLSLQLLIENAIEHNMGSEKMPISIKLLLEENTLTLQNTLRPKRNPKTRGGRALQNLRGQYELFGSKVPVISKGSDIFEIQLPLISEDAV
ncbi:sensor histidine kinase [Belliella marina]|uniref:Sensor histidine kinase n=1 Tax=Belliella marina TaxID=1644146 RepID=A0ABW4VL56_9BACT